MCQVLKVSKSGYYNWLKNQEREPTARELLREEVKQKIAKSYHESLGTYGSPRIHHDLTKQGYTLSQKTVGRLMKEMNLRAIPELKFMNTTVADEEANHPPNLLNQEFKTEHPNQVWVSDITYIWTLEGWVYLSTIMDLFSRKIVGWQMGTNMKTDLALGAFNMAIENRQPEPGLIHHSDRGSQYSSREYMTKLNDYGMKASMSRKGNPYDNACIESFFATIKKELVYRKRFNTRKEAIKAIDYYIRSFYNTRRKHSTLDYLSPTEYEKIRNKSKEKIS